MCHLSVKIKNICSLTDKNFVLNCITHKIIPLTIGIFIVLSLLTRKSLSSITRQFILIYINNWMDIWSCSMMIQLIKSIPVLEKMIVKSVLSHPIWMEFYYDFYGSPSRDWLIHPKTIKYSKMFRKPLLNFLSMLPQSSSVSNWATITKL